MKNKTLDEIQSRLSDMDKRITNIVHSKQKKKPTPYVTLKTNSTLNGNDNSNTKSKTYTKDKSKSMGHIPLASLIDEEYISNQLNICNLIGKPTIKSNDLSKRYKCYECIFSCDTIKEIEEHFKLSCIPCETYRNIYDLDPNTFGANIFQTKIAGDIYIIQNNPGTYLFKIGYSDDLNNRISQFRTGNGYEPILHYYYPVRRAEEAEGFLKQVLSKANTVGEFYKIELNCLRNIIKHVLQRVYKDELLEYSAKIKYGDVNECVACDAIFKIKTAYQAHMLECNIINKDIHLVNDSRCAFCFKEYEPGDKLMNHQLHTCNVMKSFTDKQIEREKGICEDIIQDIRKKIYYQLNELDPVDRPVNIQEIYIKNLCNMKSILRPLLQVGMISLSHQGPDYDDQPSSSMMDIISSLEYMNYVPDWLPNKPNNVCKYCLRACGSNIGLTRHQLKCTMKPMVIGHCETEMRLYQMAISDVKSEISVKKR